MVRFRIMGNVLITIDMICIHVILPIGRLDNVITTMLTNVTVDYFPYRGRMWCFIGQWLTLTTLKIKLNCFQWVFGSSLCHYIIDRLVVILHKVWLHLFDLQSPQVFHGNRLHSSSHVAYIISWITCWSCGDYLNDLPFYRFFWA